MRITVVGAAMVVVAAFVVMCVLRNPPTSQPENGR
jgi:hypothetical protein